LAGLPVDPLSISTAKTCEAGTLICAVQGIEHAVVPVPPDVPAVAHVLLPDAAAAPSMKSVACFVADATNAGDRATLDTVFGATPIVSVPEVCCGIALGANDPDGAALLAPPPLHAARAATASAQATRVRISIVTSIRRERTHPACGSDARTIVENRGARFPRS